MLRCGSIGLGGTVAMVSLAWLAGFAPADGNDAASLEHQRPAGPTTRVSVGPGGAQAKLDSLSPAISADGRYVAFLSAAWNLVPADTNRRIDVFVRDRVAHVTRRVSVGPGGVQANGRSFNVGKPSISGDGRYVAFGSFASNLVAGDTNRTSDVFVRDRKTQVTWRVSVGRRGAQSNDFSSNPYVSANGRYVAFGSWASNLVPGDTNETEDIFVRDRKTHVTRRVSVGAGGAQGNNTSSSPALSGNGRYVVFGSYARNLVAGDNNRTSDVFVRDRRAHVTRRASFSTDGSQGNNASDGATISDDGRYVAFSSDASNLVAADTNDDTDAFVRDRVAHVTWRVSVGTTSAQGNDSSYGGAISADGRYVPFYSDASNLVPGDTNQSGEMFVRDRRAHVTRRVAVGRDGGQPNNYGYDAVLSPQGRYVAFSSYASNLVAGDTNGRSDVFVRRLFD